ncbi:hypothetical protein HUG17_3619 [Dermatophagoides farinae]|nr:hypothetical protein HUG17_3619 [Dermatophagoides farinae]
MRLIHFIQLAILMAIFLWSIKIILINFVFTINEQEHFVIDSDNNNENYDDAEESNIDQIDVRSLGQRVELPIPDEELTTTTTTTISTSLTTLTSFPMESYSNPTLPSSTSTTESSIIISVEDRNENSIPSTDVEQQSSTVASTTEESNTPSFDVDNLTPDYSTTESSSLPPVDRTDSSVDFEIPMTTLPSTISTVMEESWTLMPSTTVDQESVMTITENVPGPSSSSTPEPINDSTTTMIDDQMTTMSDAGISSSESTMDTTELSSSSTSSISTDISITSSDDKSSSTEDEQESTTMNVFDITTTQTIERTATSEISTLSPESMTTVNSIDETTELQAPITTTENSLITDFNLMTTTPFPMQTTTELRMDTEMPPYSTVTTTATPVDEVTTLITTTSGMDGTTNYEQPATAFSTQSPASTTSMSKDVEPKTEINSLDIDRQMPPSFDQNNGVDSSTVIAPEDEMSITETVTTMANEEVDQEFITDQAISSHTIDMGMTTRLMEEPDVTSPLEPISSTTTTTQSILTELATDSIPTTTEISVIEGDNESRANEQPTTNKVEIITISTTTTEAPVIMETEEPTTTLSTTMVSPSVEERVPMTTVSPVAKTDQSSSSASTVSDWDQSTTTATKTTTMMPTISTKTMTTIGPSKTIPSRNPTQSNGRPSNIPFWMHFWPSNNEGWNTQIKPCDRWSHSFDMDNDEQRIESQWSQLLPQHIHTLWQRMFRLNHYRCQISNERRNIQHGLLLALEQYRDRISKEIITLSEILRPMEQPHQHSRLFQRPRSKTQEELIRLNRLLQLTSNFLKQLNRFNHYEWITN